jgi:hypothetical protein
MLILSALISLTAPAVNPFAAPVCVHGGPYVAECSGPTTNVTLDGSGSFDPDGDPLTFFWFEECPNGFVIDPTQAIATLSMSMVGTCHQQCFVQLRVTGGGQLVTCTTTVTVDDTTPPSLTCPPDALNLPFGSNTSPSALGSATASDVCHPNPTVTFTDNTTTGPNGEITIDRTWKADDGCFQPTCVQHITVDGQPGKPGELDLDIHPTSCPNPFNVGANGVWPVAIVGAVGADVADINRSTVRAKRHDGVGTEVAPLRFVLSDVATPFTGNLCNCHTLAGDGITDLMMHFRMSQVANAFQLGSVTPFTDLQIDVTGQFNDGTPFTVSDCMRVQ